MDKELEDALGQLIGGRIRKIQSLGGGDISRACLLETTLGRMFCKINNGKHAYRMFMEEKIGLEALSESGLVRTPKVFFCERFGEDAVLVLEYIEAGQPSQKELAAFGEELAALHSLDQEFFGWDSANYIGSLPQSNAAHDAWASFYLNERLQPQFNIARERGFLTKGEIPMPEDIIPVLEPLFEDVRPSLLHGDLWSGNYLISTTGQAFLFDPAVYYGHGEVDLAMSRLFGGFGKAFYEGYESVLPIAKDADKRQDVYQLYYLLVHLNLFGRSYHRPVMEILQRYWSP